MAFDGITINNIIHELKEELLGGRIDKIYQPENDELIIKVRTDKNNRLLLSSNNNFPKIHLSEIKKENPKKPPVFCMFLRKYLSGGEIVDIKQPKFDRIVEIYIKVRNDIGDLTTLKLITEIMGKHSNIILVDAEDKVLDSIKRIPSSISKREVLPGRNYTYPPSQNKENPLKLTFDSAYKTFLSSEFELKKLLYKNYRGISPFISKEFVRSLNMDLNNKFKLLNVSDKEKFINKFIDMFNRIKENKFDPTIIKDEDDNLKEFTPIFIRAYKNTEKYDSISKLIEDFYLKRARKNKLKQKYSNIHKIVKNLLSKAEKKLKIYNEDIENTFDKEKYKIKGELVTANIHNINKGDKHIKTTNYYSEDQEDIIITLDPNLSPADNAQKYFSRYNKMKRANKKLKKLIKETREEVDYLESILNSLDFADSVDDIEEIKEELTKQNYLRKKNKKKNKRKNKKSKPMHFISSDGIDIYVGKNNKQNDILTLKNASNEDTWLHTKDIPGSHVIIKSKNIPNETLKEAAHLAAYYSKARMSSKVPVDYTLKKYVNKPSGAKPGMVIYTDNKTVYITPDKKIINNLKKI